MTAQEDYNRFVHEQGCHGKSCDGCHCAFALNPDDGTFKCILVVLAEAAGVKESGYIEQTTPSDAGGVK